MTDFSEDNTEEDYLIPSYDYIRRGLRTRPPIGTSHTSHIRLHLRWIFNAFFALFYSKLQKCCAL
jgi:hypothetical protein